MKIYLDDERNTPLGWVRCYWPSEVITLIVQGGVSIVSLDHDLGDDDITGYDVVTWLEEQVYSDPSFIPPEIVVHSANPVGKARMIQGINNIKRIVSEKESSKKHKEAAEQQSVAEPCAGWTSFWIEALE